MALVKIDKYHPFLVIFCAFSNHISDQQNTSVECNESYYFLNVNFESIPPDMRSIQAEMKKKGKFTVQGYITW